MTMRWKRLGLVYRPDGTRAWAKSHAMIPTPVRLNDRVVRVYITCCDAAGIGRPGYVDLAADARLTVLGVAPEPLLDVGAPGTFDENGVLPCSVVAVGGNRVLMYYVGFELGTKIRYRLLTGLATSDDGGNSFRRWTQTPLLERSTAELYFRAGPYCVRDGDKFRLWYVGGSAWTTVAGKSVPVYDIRYAESADGVAWPTEGALQIAVTQPDEHGFGRPAVLRKADGTYRMFYSVRRISSAGYRLGYAESPDGHGWIRRDDHLQLDVSSDGFDSQAIMYAAPIEIGGRLYVFYNGNEFGKYGFAAAVLDDE
ncbi:MAG TPA: hypothetical protein VHZ24_20645 [Pirellulales bacterium]|jgi:hypothetical protein|nr:hypothetical protein [Pirellulales bacterium]